MAIFSLYCVHGSDRTVKAATFTRPKPDSRLFRSKASLQRRKLVVHRTDVNRKKDANVNRAELDQPACEKHDKILFCKNRKINVKILLIFYGRLHSHFKNACFVTCVFAYTTRRCGSCFPHLSSVWKPSG